MKLAKYGNHRNSQYLSWLRTQPCAVSGELAQCAHHIRLGTNGGAAIRPSDYFCIPLRNEHHTTGSFALHIVGEETFLAHHALVPMQLFIYYITKYLNEKYSLTAPVNKNKEQHLALLVSALEAKRPQEKREKKVKPTLVGNEFYEKSKELKRKYDKELRLKIKKPTLQLSTEQIAYKELLKEKNRNSASDFRKKQYQKAKQLRAEQRDSQ